MVPPSRNRNLTLSRNSNRTASNNISRVVTLPSRNGSSTRIRITLSIVEDVPNNRNRNSNGQSSDAMQLSQDQSNQRNSNESVTGNNDNNSNNSRSDDDATSDSRVRLRRRFCNHGLYERIFCSNCHIKRRHVCRWMLRQQYRQR